MAKTDSSKSLAKQGKGVTGANAPVKVAPSSGALASLGAAPAFIQQAPVVGTEALGQFVQMPLFKIVQPQSTKLLETHSAGTVICTAASDLVVAEPVLDGKGRFVSGTPFYFVPLMFYVEYCGWNDIDKSDAPAIFDRSFDKNSAVAKKALNPDTREEPDPEDEKLTRFYSEHLNFVVRIFDGNSLADGQVAVLSFSRGNHKDGRSLAKLIKMRGASPFACVFAGEVVSRTKDKYQWFGLACSNPSAESDVSPWVQDKELFEQFSQQHEELRQLIKGDRLRADLDVDVVGARTEAGDPGDEGDDV